MVQHLLNMNNLILPPLGRDQYSQLQLLNLVVVTLLMNIEQ